MAQLYPQDTNISAPVARGNPDAGMNAKISWLFRAVLRPYSNQAFFAPGPIFSFR